MRCLLSSGEGGAGPVISTGSCVPSGWVRHTGFPINPRRSATPPGRPGRQTLWAADRSGPGPRGHAGATRHRRRSSRPLGDRLGLLGARLDHARRRHPDRLPAKPRRPQSYPHTKHPDASITTHRGSPETPTRSNQLANNARSEAQRSTSIWSPRRSSTLIWMNFLCRFSPTLKTVELLDATTSLPHRLASHESQDSYLSRGDAGRFLMAAATGPWPTGTGEPWLL